MAAAGDVEDQLASAPRAPQISEHPAAMLQMAGVTAADMPQESSSRI